MKTTIRIIIILAITALLAGGIYLLVENTTLAGNLGAGFEGERPGFTEGERPGRAEGGEGRGQRGKGGQHDHTEGASLNGLIEVGTSLIKIGLITAIVLAIQFVFSRFRKGKNVRKLAT